MKALGMLVFVLFAMIFGLGIVFAETLNGADETSCTSSEANGMHTTKSSCTDNSGTYWDYCDSGYAKNYYCTGIYNGSWYNVKCEVGGYNCPSFGKTCSDGICIYWGNESSSSGSSSTQSTTTTNTQTTSNNTATCTVYNTEEIKRNCDAYKGTYYTKTESNGCVIPYCTYPTTTTSSTYTTGTVTSFNYLSYGVYKLYVVDGASTWVKLQIKDASGNLVSTDIVNVNDVKTYTFGTTTFRVKVL
ncbi:MAG TPA: hypothetical protein VJH34_00610, partial [archaeon]|nr:hypothetical protein [archaeon]